MLAENVNRAVAGLQGIVVPQRLVATDRFDEAWHPGEAVNTLVLSEQGGMTTIT